MPLFRTGCALVVLTIAGGPLAAAAGKPPHDRAAVKGPRAATAVAGVKVQKFLQLVLKATSLEEVKRARRAARFTPAERAELDKLISRPPYSVKMRRLRAAAMEASARGPAKPRSLAGARKPGGAAESEAMPPATAARPPSRAQPPRLRSQATPRVQLLLLRLDTVSTREQATRAVEEAQLSQEERQELDERLREPSRAARMNWLGLVIKAGQVIAAARQARPPSSPAAPPPPPADEEEDAVEEEAGEEEAAELEVDEEAAGLDEEEGEYETEDLGEDAGPVAGADPPRIVRLFPPTPFEGRRLAIGGEGFGDVPGAVTVGIGAQRGLECRVVEWTPSRLVVQMPFYFRDHGVQGRTSQEGSVEVRVPRGVATHPVRILALGIEEAGAGAGGMDRDGDGHRASEGDCDDDNGMRFPRNVEVADPFGFDEDCDPRTFHGAADGDADRDGFYDRTAYNEGAGGEIAAGDDCADGDPAVHPGQPESCNGIDDDCDGEVDEGCRRP